MAMNGRLEKELAFQQKIDKKLNHYPEIFRAYYTYLRASGRTYSTINVYLNSIIKFANYICNNNISNDFYKNITTAKIENFLINSETTVKYGEIKRTSSDTRCAYWSHINTFCEFLVKREYIEKNIMNNTNRPKNNSEHSVVFLTQNEVKKLIKATEKNGDVVTAKRDRAILSIGFATGLRCSAVSNINISDIDFENKIIKVIEKENKSREIPFSTQLESVLKDWIEVRNMEYSNINTDALFVSNKRNRISVDAINDMLKKYANKSGIKKKVTFHKCRSTLCVNALSAGVPIIVVSKQLGHNNIATTQRYADALDQDKQKLISFMDKFI